MLIYHFEGHFNSAVFYKYDRLIQCVKYYSYYCLWVWPVAIRTIDKRHINHFSVPAHLKYYLPDYHWLLSASTAITCSRISAQHSRAEYSSLFYSIYFRMQSASPSAPVFTTSFVRETITISWDLKARFLWERYSLLSSSYRSPSKIRWIRL